MASGKIYRNVGLVCKRRPCGRCQTLAWSRRSS